MELSGVRAGIIGDTIADCSPGRPKDPRPLGADSVPANVPTPACRIVRRAK